MPHHYSNVPGRVQLADGPGEGKEFNVQRAPVYLRFVSDVQGKWSVLDLPDDEPNDDEEIHIYRQQSWVHVRANRRADSGTYYTYVHVRVTNEHKATLRYTRAWRNWARLQMTEI